MRIRLLFLYLFPQKIRPIRPIRLFLYSTYPTYDKITNSCCSRPAVKRFVELQPLSEERSDPRRDNPKGLLKCSKIIVWQINKKLTFLLFDKKDEMCYLYSRFEAF